MVGLAAVLVAGLVAWLVTGLVADLAAWLVTGPAVGLVAWLVTGPVADQAAGPAVPARPLCHLRDPALK